MTGWGGSLLDALACMVVFVLVIGAVLAIVGLFEVLTWSPA